MMDSERLKQLEEAEEELRRRRERGRLAQRAFRKRQNKTRREKRDDSKRLKAAIAEIFQAARQDDRPELVRVIREAAEAAGVDQQAVNKRFSSGEGGQRPAIGPSPVVSNMCNSLSANRASSAGAGIATQGIPIPPCTSSWAGCILKNQQTALFEPKTEIGWASQRLDYGFWVDSFRFIRMDQPPSDIVPYIGKAKSTFAARLFWSCGEVLLNYCRRVKLYEKTNPRAAREAREMIWNMVQHSPPLHNIQYIIALTEARREFFDRGFIEGNNAAGEIDSALVLQERVLTDYRSRGEDATAWLSPIAVEHELRKRLSRASSDQLDRVLELWDSNEAESYLVEVLQSLIQKLSRTFICFGDGPRWRSDHISALLVSGNI